jgi:hypothetical protein
VLYETVQAHWKTFPSELESVAERERRTRRRNGGRRRNSRAAGGSGGRGGTGGQMDGGAGTSGAGGAPLDTADCAPTYEQQTPRHACSANWPSWLSRMASAAGIGSF